MSRSLALSLALVSLLVAPGALAQAAAPATASVAAVVDDAPVDLDPEVVAIVSLYGEIGLLEGIQNGQQVHGVYGPTGHLRAFVGYDLLHTDRFRLSLGYEGSVGFGYDTLTAKDRSAVLLTRHLLAFMGSNGTTTVTLGVGLGTMSSLEYDVNIFGFALQGEFGWNLGGFWIGVPFGIDVWPDWGIHSYSLGLSVGWASF